MPLTQRLPRPVLLLLVLALLALPFMTISCSGPTGKSDLVNFSGYAAVTSLAQPSSNLPGDLGDDAPFKSEDSDINHLGDAPRDIKIVNLVRLVAGYSTVAVIMLGALLTLLFPASRARSVVALASALIAAFLLSVSEFALAHLLSRLIDVAAAEANKSPDSFDLDFGKLLAAHTGFGFWVTVSYLLLFAAANLVRYLHPRTETTVAAVPSAPPTPVSTVGDNPTNPWSSHRPTPY